MCWVGKWDRKNVVLTVAQAPKSRRILPQATLKRKGGIDGDIIR